MQCGGDRGCRIERVLWRNQPDGGSVESAFDDAFEWQSDLDAHATRAAHDAQRMTSTARTGGLRFSHAGHCRVCSSRGCSGRTGSRATTNARIPPSQLSTAAVAATERLAAPPPRLSARLCGEISGLRSRSGYPRGSAATDCHCHCGNHCPKRGQLSAPLDNQEPMTSRLAGRRSKSIIPMACDARMDHPNGGRNGGRLTWFTARSSADGFDEDGFAGGDSSPGFEAL